jgi:hypothetical protein
MTTSSGSSWESAWPRLRLPPCAGCHLGHGFASCVTPYPYPRGALQPTPPPFPIRFLPPRCLGSCSMLGMGGCGAVAPPLRAWSCPSPQRCAPCARARCPGTPPPTPTRLLNLWRVSPAAPSCPRPRACTMGSCGWALSCGWPFDDAVFPGPPAGAPGRPRGCHTHPPPPLPPLHLSRCIRGRPRLVRRPQVLPPVSCHALCASPRDLCPFPAPSERPRVSAALPAAGAPSASCTRPPTAARARWWQ